MLGFSEKYCENRVKFYLSKYNKVLEPVENYGLCSMYVYAAPIQPDLKKMFIVVAPIANINILEEVVFAKVIE